MHPDITTIAYTLPSDAKLIPVAELSKRLRDKIGPIEEGRSVLTRPGFRISNRLVPEPVADLISEFREPSLVTDAVFRFSKARKQDPMDMLELSFDAVATLIERRILVAPDSPDAAAPAPSLGAGQEFAGFEIQSLVRSLEDTEVYQVLLPSGSYAALKLARNDGSDVSAELNREIEVLDLLGGIDCPGLIDYGQFEGRAYVVMEWCDGVSIAMEAQKARAAGDSGRLHQLVSRMLSAYGRIHASGVIHGDVHQGNCLVNDDGRVVVLDFGKARYVGEDHDSSDLSRTGIPHFYDPDMARRLLAEEIPLAATCASEQFSISVFAFLLMTGLHPIESSAVRDELLKSIVEQEPAHFAARGVAAWPEVESVLSRGMAKVAEDRYPNVVELAKVFSSAGSCRLELQTHDIAVEQQVEKLLKQIRHLRCSQWDPDELTWVALRAALAFDDFELLAAADILSRRAHAGFRARAIAGKIAQARSDRQLEGEAVESFLAEVEMLDVAAEELPVAIMLAADLLDGVATNRDALVLWASRSLEKVFANAAPGGLVSPAVAFAAVSLVKAGAIAVPDWLRSALEDSSNSSESAFWLRAEVCRVFADCQTRERARSASLPENLVERGFALLKLYQITGELKWIEEARILVASHSGSVLEDSRFAQLVIELKAPEKAVIPLFLYDLIGS